MFIKDIIIKRKPTVSFEVFPPKMNFDLDSLFNTIDKLKDLNPDFISVTYGSMGDQRNKTIEIAHQIKKQFNIEALAHFTCIHSSEEDIEMMLSSLKMKGIKNILALRGDLPPNYEYSKSKFKHASELINIIKSKTSLCVGAAAYPEGYNLEESTADSLKWLKYKVDCGTDFLITQLFFDNEFYYKFYDNCIQHNINIPIIAGIMPVTNKKLIDKILKLSHATLPKKFKRILEKYENNPEALREAGIYYACEQIIDLLSSGVDGVHIYTMNKAETAYKIISNISTIRNAVRND